MSPSSDLLERARALVRETLSERSAAHCERVSETAASMAERFGVDVGKARLAGLVHDLARDESDESLLRSAERLRVPILPVERAHAYLLHSRVAAAELREKLPEVGEAVLSAVETHTVGGVPMADLDKIVYVADMLEPARSFDGVERLRSACLEGDLAECFRLCYGHSMRHVASSGRTVHPISAAVAAQIERETGRPLFDEVGSR